MDYSLGAPDGVGFFDVSQEYRTQLTEWVRQQGLSESWVHEVRARGQEVSVRVCRWQILENGRMARCFDPEDSNKLDMFWETFDREGFPEVDWPVEVWLLNNRMRKARSALYDARDLLGGSREINQRYRQRGQVIVQTKIEEYLHTAYEELGEGGL